MGKFLDYALKQEAVRFVTYSDFIRWMQVGGGVGGEMHGAVVCASGRGGRAACCASTHPAILAPPAPPRLAHLRLPPLTSTASISLSPSPLPSICQDPVPLDKFDEWIDCKTPGVKADLSGEHAGSMGGMRVTAVVGREQLARLCT